MPTNRRRLPRWETISRLTPEDRKILIEAYRQIPDLLDRQAIVWALAFIGNDEVAELFKYTLTLEYAGRDLKPGMERSENEEFAMGDLVVALGVLSSSSDVAFTFLKSGTDPWFWKATLQWRSELGADIHGIFAGRSIQGLCMSGREGIPELLAEMKKRDLTNRTDPQEGNPRTLDGAVVDAVFYHDINRMYGADFFRLQMANGTIHNLYDMWKSTEKGAEWVNWSRSFKGFDK